MPEPDAPISLTLLGGAVIRSAGVPLGGPAAHRHRLALLALLAVSVSPVSRDKLIAMLWPERDAESGRNLLKVAVHELRKLLGEAAIRTTGDQLSLDTAMVAVDLVELEAHLAAGDHAKVADLYGGAFLDGFHLKDSPEFERWVEGHRNRIATVYAASIEKLALAAERSSDWRAAIEWWQKLAAHDPLRVDVALRLMRALDASGDRAAAIRLAEIHAAIRRRDFDIDADPAVDSLARELASRKAPPPRKQTLAEAFEKEIENEEKELEEIGVPAISGRAVALMLVVLVVTVVGVTVAGFAFNRRSEPATESDGIAVVPFRVVGADSSLSHLRSGMMEMLVARFGDDGPLRAIEGQSNPQGTESNQVPLAIQQGKSLGAGRVLVGDIVAGGSRGDIDVSATIYSVGDASVVGRAARTIASEASIPATVDTLAAELMSHAAGEPADRVPDLIRRPLPALRNYLAAQVAYRTGSYQRAESLFARALGVDSSFTLAGLGLALANSWNTINDHYGLGRDVALRGMKDLGARDRLFITAFFGSDPSLGALKPAPAYLQAWEDLVQNHPDFAEAWYHVGDRYYHFGGLSGLADPVDQARTAFRRALSIDPGSVAPLHHLIEIYASRGEAEEARATADRYFQSNPTVSRDASAIGWTVATVLNDSRWLARVRASFATMPPSDLSRIAWITQSSGWSPADADSALATLERRASATFEKRSALTVRYAFALNAGQVARARAAGAVFEGQLPDQPIAALWSVYASMFGEADTAGQSANLRTLAAFGGAPLSGDPDRRWRQVQARCLVGHANLASRNLVAAREDLAAVRRSGASEPAGSVQRREAQLCAIGLAAAIAVETNASDAATLVAQLDTAVLSERVPPRMPLAAAAVLAARLHERRGELKAALAASRWREHYTGDPMFLSTQLRLEGDLARELGDRPAAIRAYRRYLALRPAPDAGGATERTEAIRRALAVLEER